MKTHENSTMLWLFAVAKIKATLRIILVIFGFFLPTSFVHSQCIPYTDFLDDNSSVLIQKSNNLLWSRCLVGQDWNGIDCVGSPLKVNFSEAVLKAASLEGGWRLPSKEEYFGVLADPNKCIYSSKPTAIDEKLINIERDDKLSISLGLYWAFIPGSKQPQTAVAYHDGAFYSGSPDELRFLRLVKGGVQKTVTAFKQIVLAEKERSVKQQAQERREQAARDEQWLRDAPVRQARQMCEAQKQTCLASCPPYNDRSGASNDMHFSCERQCNRISCY